MKAAIYTRKSTEQNGQEDLASVERQKDACLAFAKERGFTVDPVNIFNEGDGVSGTIAFEKRPAMARLLAAAARRDFSVLVAWRDDRLSREDNGGLVALLRILSQSGVKVFYAQSGKEASTSGLGVVLGAVEGYGSAAYAVKIQADTKKGRADRFEKIEGWCSGTPPYGYVGVRIGDGRDGHTVLAPDPVTSKVVTRIFEAIADGTSVRALAGTLNAEQIPAGTRGKDRGEWKSWTIATIVRNRTYIGETSLNGAVKKSDKVRLISDALWASTQRVLAVKVEKYAAHRDENGKLKGRPEGGRLTPYIFSDHLVCGVCGSKMWILPNRDNVYARCKRANGGGDCSNRFGLPYHVARRAIAQRIGQVKPEQIETLIRQEAARAQANVGGLKVEVESARKLVADLEQKVERLVDAVEDGQDVGGRLKARRVELDKAREALAASEVRVTQADLDGFDWQDWRGWMQEAFYAPLDTIAIAELEGNPEAGRQVLRLLLPQPIRVTPTVEDGKRTGWTFDGVVTVPSRAATHRGPTQLSGLGITLQVSGSIAS